MPGLYWPSKLRRRSLQYLHWRSLRRHMFYAGPSGHEACAFRALQAEMPRWALKPSQRPTDCTLGGAQHFLGRHQGAIRELQQAQDPRLCWGALPTVPRPLQATC